MVNWLLRRKQGKGGWGMEVVWKVWKREGEMRGREGRESDSRRLKWSIIMAVAMDGRRGGRGVRAMSGKRCLERALADEDRAREVLTEEGMRETLLSD